MKFHLKKNVKTLLAAGLTHFKNDWEMRLTHLHDDSTSKPFPGDMYHCELFMDSSAPEVDSIPLSSYVASAYAGGMRQQTEHSKVSGEDLMFSQVQGLSRNVHMWRYTVNQSKLLIMAFKLSMRIQILGFVLVTKFPN